jgi:hypothetical protein
LILEQWTIEKTHTQKKRPVIPTESEICSGLSPLPEKSKFKIIFITMPALFFPLCFDTETAISK